MKRGKLTGHERILYALAFLQVFAGIFLGLMGVIDFAVAILVATLGGLGMARIYRDRSQYNSGWLNGRIAMFASLSEARQRGLHPIEWMIAEAERDGFEVSFIEDPDH